MADEDRKIQPREIQYSPKVDGLTTRGVKPEDDPTSDAFQGMDMRTEIGRARWWAKIARHQRFGREPQDMVEYDYLGQSNWRA